MRMKVWTLSPPPGDRCWWSPTVWRKVSSVESVTSCRTLLLSLCMSFSPCLWSVSRCTSLEKRSMFNLSCHCCCFFSRSHSCMELVLWRPPEDPFCRKQRDSIHRHLKQQTASSLSMTPCPSPAPRSPPSPPADTRSSLFSLPAERSCGEEEMEME